MKNTSEKTYENDMNQDKALLALLLAVFIDILGFGIIIPILPFWVTKLGSSELMFGFLLAIYSLFQFIFAPIWGRLSDRIGRRPVILIGMMGAILGFVLLLTTALLVPTIEMLFLARIVGGIFTSATLPTSQAYISDTSSIEERTKKFGFIGAAMGLGFALGPALGGLFTTLGKVMTPSLNGYWFPAFFATGLTIINLLIGIRYLPESLSAEKRKSLSNIQELQSSKSSTKIFSMVGKNSKVFLILALFAILNLAMYIFEATIPLFGKNRFGLNEVLMGLGFLTAGIVMILTQGGLLGVLSKRLSETKLISLGFLIFMVSFIGLSTIDSFFLMVVWILPFAFGFSLTQPSLGALLSKNVQKEKYGEFMGLNEGITALMRVIGPLIGTVLFTFDMLFPFYAEISILALAVFTSLILGNLMKSKVSQIFVGKSPQILG